MHFLFKMSFTNNIVYCTIKKPLIVPINKKTVPIPIVKTEWSSYILYRDADAGLEDKGQLFGRHDFHPVEGAYHQPEVKLL